MSPEDRSAYDYYLDTLVRDTDVMKTKLLEARIEGEKQGIEKGIEKGIKKGIEKGIEQGRAEGLEKGMEQGLAKGLAKGLAEGRAKGRYEEKVANARSLKENGVPSEVIAKSLGMPIEEIEKL